MRKKHLRKDLQILRVGRWAQARREPSPHLCLPETSDGLVPLTLMTTAAQPEDTSFRPRTLTAPARTKGNSRPEPAAGAGAPFSAPPIQSLTPREVTDLALLPIDRHRGQHPPNDPD